MHRALSTLQAATVLLHHMPEGCTVNAVPHCSGSCAGCGACEEERAGSRKAGAGEEMVVCRCGAVKAGDGGALSTPADDDATESFAVLLTAAPTETTCGTMM